MFRRFSAAAAILCGLALSACNVTTSQVAGLVISAQTIATVAGKGELVAAAQDRVVKTCGFLPTAQTIAAIAKTFAPDTRVTLDLVDTVASGICAAVANPTVAYASSRKRPRPGTYRGVKPKGEHVAPPAR